MKIAVASGKGGTGKTTIAVNLALSAQEPVRLLDCDVEEPNCHIFLKPELNYREVLGIPVPHVDAARCTLCGKCGEICQYNAVAVLASGVMVFEELCHGCGGCALVCPSGAVSERSRKIGVLETGHAGAIEFVHGRLRVGEALSPPLVRAVARHALPNRLNIIDAPPGTACPVVAAIRDCDFVMLVTEPTPFGLHDLTLAVETVREMGIRFGVVVNRADVGDDRVKSYCRDEGIDILLEIGDDRRIAEAYSRGQPAVEAMPQLGELFAGLHAQVRKSFAQAACGKPGGGPDADL